MNQETATLKPIQQEKEVPEGYQQTEVGVIPVDWNIELLGNVVHFLDHQRRPVKSSDRAKIRGIFPYYGASGIIDYVNDYIFDEELILFGEDGENIISRHLPLVFKVSGKIWVNNHAHILKPVERVNIDYLTNFLESNDYKDYNTGTAQPKINRRSCSRISVALPPLKEQTAIATVLSDVDILQESLDKLIAKKRAIKQATMQQLLTGKKRLPGFSGAWETKRLGEIGNFYKGKNIKRDEITAEGVPCIRYGEIYTKYNDYIKKAESRIPDYVAKKAFLLKKGDLLFAGSGETANEIGKCIAYVGESATYAGGDIVVFRPKEGYSLYLGHLMNVQSVANQKASLGQGDAVVHIHAHHLSSVEFFMPPINEQRAIANLLVDMDAEIEALKHRREKTQQIKQGMMQELFTGRTRLVNTKEVFYG